MEWDKHQLSDFDDERGTGLIRIEILDRIDCEKVEHGRRCNMLLDADWLKLVELGPSIEHML